MTTEVQIEAMREMCRNLVIKNATLVKTAIVDDWGRNGNFQIFVEPHKPDRYFTTRLRAMLGRVMPEGARLRMTFGPDTYVDQFTKEKKYSRNSWTVDVDYQRYCAETNSFS